MSQNVEPISAFAMYVMKRTSEITMKTSTPKKVKFNESAIINESNQNSTIVRKATPRKIKLNNSSGKINKSNQNSIIKTAFQQMSGKQKNKSNLSITKNKVNTTNKKKKLCLKTGHLKPKEKIMLRRKLCKKRKSGDTKQQLYNNVSAYNYAMEKLPKSLKKNPLVNSINLFKWLIYPIEVKTFLDDHWEKNSVFINRKKSWYFNSLASMSLLDKILRENHIMFTKNIDITSYTNGVKELYNPVGRAVPSVVWDYYMNDCSIRFLNPQTYIQELYSLNAGLQEFFGCFVGANLYLTPPNSQGFAPHYDDIEAFVLQIEGKKRWRLYEPPRNEFLARHSSKNFDQSELGEPVWDIVLTPGDILYFPRGTIHQAETVDGCHSLHITLSVYQQNSWYDFFKELTNHALQCAAEADSYFRSGMPLDYLRYFGIARNHNMLEARSFFYRRVKASFSQLINYLDIDAAADLMAKRHIHDFLPPALTKKEQRCSVMQTDEEITSDGKIRNRVQIKLDTMIRLLRWHCVRLVKEDDEYKLYFSTENTKEYHEYELQFLEVAEEFVPPIKKIIRRYPKYICVRDLPIADEDSKIQLVNDLWEKGIIVTKVPLAPVSRRNQFEMMQD